MLNVLGLFCGAVVFAVMFFITDIITSFALTIPLVAAIMNFLFTPMIYKYGIMFLFSIAISFFTYDKICAGTKYKWGGVVLGVLIAVFIIFTMYKSYILYGVTDQIWSSLIAIGLCAYYTYDVINEQF